MNRLAAFLKMSVFGLVVFGLTGCEAAQRQHAKNIDDANNRWNNVRSASMAKVAQQHFEAGDLDQAEKTLASAISVDQKNPHLLVLSGRVALERGQLERSYHRFQAALDMAQETDLPTASYFQGIILQRWSRFDASLEKYRAAYDQAPDNVSYLLATAEMLVALDREDEALKLLVDRVVYFDQNAGIRTAVGHLYGIKGDFKKATEYFEEAALLQPEDLQILEDLALAQVAAGRYRDAIENLRRLGSEPGHSTRLDLKRALACAYQGAGLSADARAIYIKLTHDDPNDIQSWVSLGQLSWEQGDTTGALLAAGRIEELDSSRHEGFLLAGMVWYQRGQIDRALEMYEQAASLAPDSAAPVLLRGIALEEAGRASDAADAYNEALRRNPDDARARQLLTAVSISIEGE